MTKHWQYFIEISNFPDREDTLKQVSKTCFLDIIAMVLRFVLNTIGEENLLTNS